MKRLIFLLLVSTTLLSAQETDTLYILQTTDVHGNIYPYDYFKDEPDEDRGLAKIFTRVAEYRKTHSNVLLLDGGDLLQGTPMIYYFNKIETDVPNPMILTMNYMGYDAFAVGNHDIEQGLFTYLRAQKESDFPWLSANSVLPDGRTFFDPYTIIEYNGITIGIIGLTTPGIPMWLDKTLYPGVTWTDMIETAREYAEMLRPEVDVLVGLFHAGFNEDYSGAHTNSLGLPNENASRLVAEQVPLFDVVFAGHSHRDEVNVEFKETGSGVKSEDKRKQIKEKREEKTSVGDDATLLVNAGSWARNLGVAEIIVRENGGGWQVAEKNGWLEPMKEVKASEAILQLNEYYHLKTLDYIRTEIGTLTDTLSGKNSRFEDSPFIELVNLAQMDYTKADISFAASFNDRLKIAPGPIKIKDIYSMYRYENFLYVVEMTGQQIKDYLEYSSRFYIWDGKKITENPDVRGYNYDMAEGIGYQIDVREKTGSRIKNLTFLRTGKPLDMKKIYRVAMNSYRATGGGGHMAAAGASEAPVVFKANEEIRNILAEYIKKQGTIKPKADGNWKVETGSRK